MPTMTPDEIEKQFTSVGFAYLLPDGDCHVYIQPDPRGESEAYERWMLVGMRDNHMVWQEGIRKDRSRMREDYRNAVDAAIAAATEGNL